MVLDRFEYVTLEQFIAEHAGTKLGENAIIAWLEYEYRSAETETDDYVVFMVDKFYCISRIIDEWSPIEICSFVKPFDDIKTYHLQEVHKKIQFVQ